MIRRLTHSWRKEVCPYCFEEYRLRDTPFRCTTPAGRCSPQVDEVRKDAWEDSAPMGRVLESQGKVTDRMRCQECGQVSRKRLCPECHMELPHTTGEFDNFIFAVIGAKEAGKSHYIAVLIDQLRKVVGPSMGMLLSPLDDATVKRYREAFHEPLFRDGTVIRGTVSALADRKVQMPLVYSLTFGGRGFLGGRRITKAVTLVFFDTAGEDLDSEDTMATVNKYIYRSDGIILLLDPLQLPWVRDQLATGTSLPSENTETGEIIDRVSQLVLRGRDLRPDSMVPVPLAVTFSKFDAVEPLVDAQLQLNSDARHEAAFDTADFAAVDAEMRSLLARWDSEAIPHQVATRFKDYGFFGLSALGCNPHGTQQVPRVLPRRTEDPFLWLLHHHGLIPAAEEDPVRYWFRTHKQQVLVWGLGVLLVVILLLLGAQVIGGSASLPPSVPPDGPSPSPGIRSSPVQLKNLRLRNEAQDGAPLGDFSTRFAQADLRYLAFYAALESVEEGVVNRGSLRARYVDPNGEVMLIERGPRGASVTLNAEVGDSVTLTGGIGNPTRSIFPSGTYVLQIWWDDALLGDERFEVVP